MKHKKSHVLFLAFVGIVLLFFVANRLFFFSPTFLEQIASYITYPSVLMQQMILDPYKKRSEHKATVAELTQRLDDARRYNEVLCAENTQLQATMSYVRNSDDVAQYVSRYDMSKGTLARVIHKHCADDEQYILVDAGADNGIEEDMVAVYKNCLLGRVSKAYARYSKIILISDKNCKVAAVCVNTNVRGIHVGCNTWHTTELSHVSHLLTLQQGDLIISSGEGLIFPQGFGLGVVESFETQGLNYAVRVKPLAHIQCIDYCYVLKKRNT